MDRSQKEGLVSEIKAKLTDCSLVVVTHQSGLSVGEVTTLRREVRAASAEFKVLKNTLAHIAVQDTALQPLQQFLKGPTALAYSKDPVAAAKAIVKFANKNDKLKIVGGYLDGQVLNQSGVKALAELPSLDELRAKLLAVILAPASQLVRTINEPGAQVARVIAAKARA